MAGTAGLNAVGLANKLLNSIGGTGTTFTAGSLYVQLHTDANSDAGPGVNGTANVSANTTRQLLAFSAAASGSKSLSASPTAWSMTATENIKYITLWDASTAGNFLWMVTLTSPKSVVSGDSLQLTSLTLALTPIAA